MVLTGARADDGLLTGAADGVFTPSSRSACWAASTGSPTRVRDIPRLPEPLPPRRLLLVETVTYGTSWATSASDTTTCWRATSFAV